MDAKQFAWVYLIEHGRAGVTHSYYGGYDLVPEAVKMLTAHQRSKLASWHQQQAVNDLYLKKIKIAGVDWAKTHAPDSDSVDEFNGTFADPGRREILQGTLVLLDGTKQQWCANAIEVTNVFEMMAAVSSGQTKFQEIFG